VTHPRSPRFPRSPSPQRIPATRDSPLVPVSSFGVRDFRPNPRIMYDANGRAQRSVASGRCPRGSRCERPQKSETPISLSLGDLGNLGDLGGLQGAMMGAHGLEIWALLLVSAAAAGCVEDKARCEVRCGIASAPSAATWQVECDSESRTGRSGRARRRRARARRWARRVLKRSRGAGRAANRAF